VEAPRIGSGSAIPSILPGIGSEYGFGGPGGPGSSMEGDGRSIPWSSSSIRSDSTLVGSYNQPAWTTQRPWPTVRTYVLPEGQMQIEQWYRPRWKKDGSREDRLLEELAIGLPHRFQLDIYYRWNIQQNDANMYQANHEGVQIELRYALADWDVIPLNPTLYAEWVQRDTKNGYPDKYELKLLLADQYLNGRLFYAANFILEKEVGGDRETELGISQALSTPIIERKLLGGVEMWFRSTTVHGDRGNPENEFLIGPALQWRPTNRTFVNVSPLFGVTNDAPKVELFIVAGFQFGARAAPSFGGVGPSSLSN